MRHSAHRVAAVIQDYCAAHPNACDTIEGLAWWAALQYYDEMRSVMAEAVGLLVDRGVLQRSVLQDGSVVFGCHRDRDRDGDPRSEAN